MITFRQTLNYMETGEVFTCRVVSYDHTRKKGGDVNEYEAVLLTRDEEEAIETGRPKTRLERGETRALPRRPNHAHWYTRNIRLVSQGLPTMVIKKIHIPLMVNFNGQTVVP